MARAPPETLVPRPPVKVQEPPQDAGACGPAVWASPCPKFRMKRYPQAGAHTNKDCHLQCAFLLFLENKMQEESNKHSSPQYRCEPATK